MAISPPPGVGGFVAGKAPQSIGALGWFGVGIEAIKGTPVPITSFIMLNANGIEANPDVMRKTVYAATRQSERIIRTVKFKIGGTIAHDLFPNMGIEVLTCVLGRDSYLAPLTADTLAAPAAAAVNNLQQLHLTNTAAQTYTKGAWLYLDAAPHIWPTRVLDVANNGAAGTIITIPAVPAEASASQAAGTAVLQPGQHMFRVIPPNDLNVMILPTATVQMNEAQRNAWELAGTYFAKYNLKGGREDIQVTETVACTRMPKRLNRPRTGEPAPWTPWAPTSDELADAQRPYTIVDGEVIVAVDNGDGTNSLQALGELSEFEFDWDNGMLDKAYYNRNRVYDVIPGPSKSMFRYRYDNTALRNMEFEDYLAQPWDRPVPAFVSLMTNLGSDVSPDWALYGIYLSATLITKAPTQRPVGDVQGIDVEADVTIGPSGEEPVRIFVVNATTTAYAGA